MKAKTTTEVVEQFNQAFEQHDASLLTDLVGEQCVMESVEPAPDGTRYVGRDVNLAFWQNLANNKDGAFSAEDIATFGDRATIRWRFRFGARALAIRSRGNTHASPRRQDRGSS